MHIKQYNENGELLNPITKENPFIIEGLNRVARRESLQKKRFVNNRKTTHLTINRISKYLRYIQEGKKRTYHYILK